MTGERDSDTYEDEIIEALRDRLEDRAGFMIEDLLNELDPKYLDQSREYGLEAKDAAEALADLVYLSMS